MLDREEYVEQAYFFRTMAERLPANEPIQELLGQIRDEVLSTTNLPKALDFMLTELIHVGVISTAMARLPHYFTPFQTYLIQEAENEIGRFDMRVAIEVLRFEAEYRAKSTTPAGLFLYQFETICRNRLSYDGGLRAIAHDPAFDEHWREWILMVRRQVGMVDFADLLYVYSEHYRTRQAKKQGRAADETNGPVLFGEKEGKIALANRLKNPLFLFAALQRHLDYPPVPRARPKDTASEVLPKILRQLERLEVRVKLLEDEQKGGFDLSKFYRPPSEPAIDLKTGKPKDE